MRKLLVVLVILGLVAVVADRIAHKFATDEAQRRLVAAGLASPQVDVRGFPFLTQLIARHFDDVEVTAPSLRIGTGTADDISGTAHDVEVPNGGPATVGRLDARGTIPYAEVLRQVDQSGLRLSNAGAGQVKLAQRVSVLGLTHDIVARGRVEAKGNRLLVTPTSFRLAGGGVVDKGITRLLGDRFTFSYRVRGLPKGVHVDRITPADDGFVVDVSGRDVALAT